MTIERVISDYDTILTMSVNKVKQVESLLSIVTNSKRDFVVEMCHTEEGQKSLPFFN